ncbi:MAG TPA: cupin domain-containing protein [Herpetosiphon sp.]|nr:cupin domain-containing protein [Herpetosiphon sp.]
MMMINLKNAEHYVWGDGCDGWFLHKSAAFTLIQERVPVGKAEVRHYHEYADQVFYVLQGVATLEVDGIIHQLQAGDSLAIPVGAAHQLSNQGPDELHFLLISQPNSHGDRVLAPLESA